MGARRKKENIGLPPNLYKRKGIYYYRDTRTKKEYSLGKNRTLAITETINANLTLSNQQTSLIDRINNVKVVSLHDWLDEYHLILQNRGLKNSTLKFYSNRINILKNNFSNVNLEDVTTRLISDFIGSYSKRKPTMAKLLKSLLSDALNEAIARGIIDKNSASVIKNPRVVVQRPRLTLEQFNYALLNANDKYRNIFLLAILTGQRISDLVKLKWTDIQDDKIFIQQLKTDTKIAISIDLHLKCVDCSIRDVLNNLHNNKETVCNTSISSLRNWFAKCLPASKKNPTFHEIRSLSARLYEKERGAEFASALLGHKSMLMTSKYLDVRNNEYKIVS